jgi:hypothetical protein
MIHNTYSKNSKNSKNKTKKNNESIKTKSQTIDKDITNELKKLTLKNTDNSFKFIILYLQIILINSIIKSYINISFATIMRFCDPRISNLNKNIKYIFYQISEAPYNIELASEFEYGIVIIIRRTLVKIYNGSEIVVESLEPLFEKLKDKYSKKIILTNLNKLINVYPITDYNNRQETGLFEETMSYKRLSIFYTENKKSINQFFEGKPITCIYKPVEGGGTILDKISDIYHYAKEKTISLNKEEKSIILQQLEKSTCKDENKIFFYKLFLMAHTQFNEPFIFEDITKINNVIIIDNIDNYLDSITDKKYKKNVIKYLRFLLLNKQQYFIISEKENNLTDLYKYGDLLYGYGTNDYFIKLILTINKFYITLYTV